MSRRKPFPQDAHRLTLSLACGVILIALFGFGYADAHRSQSQVAGKAPATKAATKLHASKVARKLHGTKARIKPPATKASCKLPSANRAHQLPDIKGALERLDEQHLIAATKGLDFSSGMVRVKAHIPGGRAKALEATGIAERSLSVENTWFIAAGHFRDAILADPKYAPAYEGFARSVLVEGNTGIAEAALRTAISLDPNFGKARFELGASAQMTGDYTGAVAIWKGLVTRDPGYSDAYARMAIASYFGQDFKSAWTYLDEADKRKQNVPPQFRELLRQVAPRP